VQPPDDPDDEDEEVERRGGVSAKALFLRLVSDKSTASCP
jgi:hypothetical protein